MRTIWKELRKMFDLRLIMILALFSIVYIGMFWGAAQAGWNYSKKLLSV